MEHAAAPFVRAFLGLISLADLPPGWIAERRSPFGSAFASPTGWLGLASIGSGARPVVGPDALPITDRRGVEVLHLQCASGEETLTLALASARVTGVDFGEADIGHATAKARFAGIAARFLVADLYDLPFELPAGSFDVVFTGGGSLVWLPNIRRWAGIAASCLRPGGRLLLWDVHPSPGAIAAHQPLGSRA